ncbi:MAG TPA: D-2-hydroxyacid dehydrogenase [Rhodanobacteraceae bacterium]|nr:D-2-hydroxyacid dehydrogenase [Rhodanobacteraceae bacterium]
MTHGFERARFASICGAAFLQLFGGLAVAQPADCAHCEEAAAIAARFELAEGGVPTRDRQGWAPPHKIVTMGGEKWARLLRAVAPTAEIVAVESPPDAVAALPGADIYVGLCNAAIVEAGTDLRLIHMISAGADPCASDRAIAEQNILLTSSQGLHSPAVADHAWALLLAATRRLPAYGVQQRRGVFDDPWANARVVFDSGIPELEGRALLVVGLGGIGTEIARRGSGFGMHIRGTRNSGREAPDFVEYVGLADETMALVAWADVVVNALPLTAQTRGLFDKNMFAAMKRTAVFVNVGRGETVVTADLVAALQNGVIAGAGLDVSDPEPLSPGHPLWNMPNVVLTPHMAAASNSIERRLAVLALENVRRYAAGDRLLQVVETRRGY